MRACVSSIPKKLGRPVVAMFVVCAGVVISPVLHAHQNPLNSVGCHTERRTGEYHCHEDGNFNRKVEKRTSFSGFESRAAEPKKYDKELVREIQEQLQLAGYQVGVIDGLFGSNTKVAIRQFEEENGFKVTGQPTEYILAKLKDFNKREANKKYKTN